MSTIVVVVGLLAATVVCVTLGQRLQLPYPILMLLAATASSFIPGFPVPEIDPEVILPLFLPPLLFATAQNTSWAVFRRRWKVLLVLALGLTALTALAVAGTISLLVPGVSIPLALLLGAMVAPPDPVAVEAVAGPARMPRRIMTVLQTEGLFNDAVAIVLFQAALVAAAEHSGIGPEVLLRFIVGAVVAVAIGFGIGYGYRLAGRLTRSLPARVAVSVVAPFVAYILADALGASGVIAVVVTALETNRRRRTEDGDVRVTQAAFWDVANMLVTGVAFGLMGLEMRALLRTEGDRLLQYTAPVVVTCVVVIAVRYVVTWALVRFHLRWRQQAPWRSATLLTWCGMRGLATLALALSVPSVDSAGQPIAERSLVIMVACAVLLVTLVPTGLTLPVLSRRLLDGEVDTTDQEIARVVRRAQQASLRAVRDLIAHSDYSREMRDVLSRRFGTLRQELQVDHIRLGGTSMPGADAVGHGAPGGADVSAAQVEEFYFVTSDEEKRHRAEMREMIRQATNAAREEVLRARDEADVDPTVADAIVRQLDLRMMATPGLDAPPDRRPS